MLDLNVARFKVGVQTDVVIVGVLLEVVEHPVLSEMLCFGIPKEVSDVWVPGEILDQAVSVDFSCLLDCVAARTVIDGGYNSKATEDDRDKCRGKHDV